MRKENEQLPYVIETQIYGKTIKVYKAEGINLPIIYSNDYSENGLDVLKACASIDCPLFHLVTISGFDWDAYMSPWASNPVVSKDDNFEGKGQEHLKFLLEKTMPYAQSQIGENGNKSYIAGYSMGGLFALWSMYETDFFDGCVCASGSLWFPSFKEFVMQNSMKKAPDGIYLSLGDRESKTRNQVLRTTESVYRELESYYKAENLNVTFELNPGNHFKDEPLRMAKGFKWIL